GGGGGGGAATKAIITGGIGSASAAISGIITSATMSTVWTAIDSGTEYHFRLPTLTDGLTTSPNISLLTAILLLKIGELQKP
ncbi:hypothetical protein HY629_02090, partial [Candidatus Uhrbacteria bacterium]|nr:hypothetical protein [Candidatus Uhrbacteria bacterium]